ncbi:MAG: sigma-54 dependent transcriptional regulator [Acidobacteriota bacterium]
MSDILVVDDDQSVSAAFREFLGYEGHEYRIASNAEEAVRLIAERRPALVMMDVRMPGVDGLQALQDIRGRFPDVSVVMMTGYGTSQTSIDAIRAGAFDYLTKPLDLDELRAVIRKALASRPTIEATGEAPGDEARPRLVGDAAAMREVYKTIGRLATVDVPTLVVGEHGTGKHLVVATIHENSGRRDQPLRVVACAAVSDGDFEARLTDPAAGTLHLADIDALPAGLQRRLAEVLATPRPREGSTGARIVGTTEKNLEDLASAGSFNRDLHALLAVVTVTLPTLRARREDIPLLTRHFLQRFNAEFDRTIKGVDDDVTRALEAHSWPGNVGELERVIKRASILARGDVITLDAIAGSLARRQGPVRGDVDSDLAESARAALQERIVAGSGTTTSSSVYHEIVDVVEATLVREALTITNGNQVKAAAILGVNRTTLRKKMPAES